MDVSLARPKERQESTKNGTVDHTSRNDLSYKQVGESLDKIRQYLKQELEDKQAMIEKQRSEIQMLQQELHQRTTTVESLLSLLQQAEQSIEGHRQLVQKLQSDISQCHNDIDWYKRTYEKRSIGGVLKEKLSRRK
jgi:septal ring factor EnvC (AmiA/AmiB activator)